MKKHFQIFSELKKACSLCFIKYDENIQLDVAIEEMAELIKELIKHKRNFDNKIEIINEMADCIIMFAQLIQIFDCEEELNKAIGFELIRLLKRVSNKKV